MKCYIDRIVDINGFLCKLNKLTVLTLKINILGPICFLLYIQYINALPCSSNKKTKTIKTHQLISYFLNWAFMGPFASKLFSNFGSINTHTYIYPVSEKLTSSPKPVGLETVYFGLNFIITI